MSAVKPSKEVTVFMCGVDWQHEIGEAAGGNTVYASVSDLKKNRKCWKECGIVAVKVRRSKWMVKQDFTELMPKRRKEGKK